MSKRASIGVRKNGFRSVLGRDFLQPGGDLIQSFVPGDSGKVGGVASTLAFGRDPLHGIENAVGRIDPIQILGHLRAQETSRYRVSGIALYACGSAVLHRDQHSAGVWTIVRTGGVDDLLHSDIIELFVKREFLHATCLFIHVPRLWPLLSFSPAQS
jgi:hypothetical protein